MSVTPIFYYMSEDVVELRLETERPARVRDVRKFFGTLLRTGRHGVVVDRVIRDHLADDLELAVVEGFQRDARG
jgi:hypothetical protein